MCSMCVPGTPWRPDNAQRHHRTGVMEYCEPWCGYWKLNPGFSGRTASVSTVELSVQPLNYFFKALNFKFKELMDFFLE